jgi:hypothetical protein
MRGFLLGVIVAGLGFGGYTYWKQRGSAARAPVVADAGVAGKETRDRKKKRRRGALRIARNDTFTASPTGTASPASPTWSPSDLAATEAPPLGEAPPGQRRPPPPRMPAPMPAPPEPEPVKLSAADLRMVSQGDDLSRPDVLRLDMSKDDSGSHELSQDEIDARFRAKEDAILSCIARARPDEETWVPGRVTVKFRIQRSGNVRGVRVEAPAILQKGGLYGCIKGVLGGLRFGPSSGSQVISYPFTLT